ncbi:MAG: PAS domain-containing protein [Candidatus Omnitrophica bacterium]|nr:PAS domain-containing protein [Candidatus Omnitrophota bacterium]
MVEDSCALLNEVFKVIPVPILVVDGDIRIIFANPRAEQLFSGKEKDFAEQRIGEVLVCKNSQEKGCGRSQFCSECVLRNSVKEALKKDEMVQGRARLHKLENGNVRQVYFYVTTVPVKLGNRPLSLLMLEDVGEIMPLMSLLPICSGCKKIRDENGQWVDLVGYMEKNMDIDFSHSFCQDCLKTLYPDVWEDMQKTDDK